jgi:hypothetical protein
MVKKKIVNNRDVSPKALHFQQADPDVPLHCPTCGEPLVFIRTDGKTHIYRCPHHGLLILPPDGRVRPQPSREPQRRGQNREDD